MAEEQRLQEGHRLCANKCGFFGSPATLNLCSKCYGDLRLKEQQAASAKIALGKSLSSPASPSTSAAAAAAASSSPSVAPSEPSATIDGASPAVQRQEGANRCASCRKRVGLTGFRCRCGATYCGAHRYPEQHGCGFDYKAAGRDSIARANPVVKADKLDRRI